MLTFDDGFADFYWTVAPILTERGLPATLYVTVGAIHPPGGEPTGSLLPDSRMLNWRQVGTLDAVGVEIGGHSQTHAQLDTVYGQRRTDEIVGSKKRLEDAIGHPATAFAYPHGYSSPAVRRQVRAAGWTSATAVENKFSSATDDPMRICRLMVRSDTPDSVFDDWTASPRQPRRPDPGEPLHPWLAVLPPVHPVRRRPGGRAAQGLTPRTSRHTL
ncbi:polysaccharide deacetylase family protein [Kitasatospora arboriphila]